MAAQATAGTWRGAETCWKLCGENRIFL